MNARDPIPGWGAAPGAAHVAPVPDEAIPGWDSGDPAEPAGRGIAERLGDTWRIYRAERRAVLWLSLAILGTLGLAFVPASISSLDRMERLWAAIPVTGSDRYDMFDQTLRSILPFGDPVSAVATALAPGVAALAILLLVGAYAHLLLAPVGEDRTVRAALRVTLGRAIPIGVPAVIVALAVGLIVAASLLTFERALPARGPTLAPGQVAGTFAWIIAFDVGLLALAVAAAYAVARWALAIPALVLEHLGLRAAFRRSSELTRGRRISVLITVGAMAALAGWVSSLGTLVAILLFGLGSSNDARFVVGFIITFASWVLVMPLVALAPVELYRDFAAAGPRAPR